MILFHRAVYHQSPASKAGNETVFTEIVGNVRTVDDQNYYALATLDGTIMLMDNDGGKIYDISVGYQLFGLTKLDITVSQHCQLISNISSLLTDPL